MESSQKINALESELSRLLHWIGAAEAKLSYASTVALAMLTGLSIFGANARGLDAAGLVFAWTAGVLLGATIACGLASLFPRMSKPGESLVYFGDIAGLRLEEYRAAFKTSSAEDYADDLIESCHRCAQVAASKFAWVRRALICLALAGAPWLAALHRLNEA